MGIDLVASLLVLSGIAEGGITYPRECYTCQSRLESNICGEGFRFPIFLQKFCHINQPYCIKVIEKAGRTPLVYRKCSNVNCEEEIKQRQGEIIACSVCTTSLCNTSTVSSTISSLIYLLMIAIVFYHLNILTLLEQS